VGTEPEKRTDEIDLSSITNCAIKLDEEDDLVTIKHEPRLNMIHRNLSKDMNKQPFLEKVDDNVRDLELRVTKKLKELQ
jgi:hypothetical protein